MVISYWGQRVFFLGKLMTTGHLNAKICPLTLNFCWTKGKIIKIIYCTDNLITLVFPSPPLSVIFLTYAMASDTFPSVALLRDFFQVTILLSNRMRAKWSSLSRSFRMAASASRVCKSSHSRKLGLVVDALRGSPQRKVFYLSHLCSAHWSTSINHKHHVLWDSGQVRWSEEVHKVAIHNLRGDAEPERPMEIKERANYRSSALLFFLCVHTFL